MRAIPLPLLPLILMSSVPFLMPHHRLPLPTFFQEWWAVVCGLLAALALLLPRYRPAFALPRTALLPLALAVLILAQGALMPEVKSDTTLLAALYLGWAALVMAVARSFAHVHGASPVALALAVGVVAGALGSALLVALQSSGALRATGWVSAPIGNRLFGNLNQPNHLSLQLWLGVAAVLYLNAKGRLRLHAALPAVLCLVGASLLAGSRAVVAYAAVLPILALWQHRTRGTDRSMLAPALFALAATLAGQFLLAQFAEPASPTTLAQREWGKESDTIRGGLWWMAVRMGLEHPLAGIGWERFASHTFTRLTEFRAFAPPALILVPAEHAHNLFLQLLAELGVGAPLLVLAFGGLWLAGVVRRPPTTETHFALALVVLLTLHGQVEYTLWYSFFLGIAAIALALGEARDLRFPLPRPALVLVVLTAALATAGLLRHDYARLENTMRWPLTEDGSPPPSWKEVSAEMIELRHRSRFGSYVDLALAGAMQFDREQLKDKLALCDAAIAFSPTDYAVFKCAALLALDGRPDAARDRLERALWAYPEQAATFIAYGNALAERYPELLPLVEAARAFARERKLIT